MRRSRPWGSGRTVKVIEAALYKYKLVVIKDQHDLQPMSQYEFNRRFDVDASGLHGHGTGKEVSTKQFKGKVRDFLLF